MAFATDDTYSDPGEAWDGQPTKVAPSGGIELTGFVPGQPVSVEFLNYLLNLYSTENDDRRLEKVLNWRLAPDKDQTGLGTTTPWVARATWDKRQLYAVSNGTIIQVSYNEGQTWTTDDTLASAVYSGIASLDPLAGDETTSSICACMTLTGAARVSMRGQTATWADQALTGGASALNVVAEHSAGYFWVVGQLTAGTAPAIWGIDGNDGATGGTIVTAHPGAGSYALETVAVGGGFGLAARTGGTGLWRWDTSTLVAAAVTLPSGTGDVRDIVWNEHDGLFYLVRANGGQPIIFRSPTGATGDWSVMYPAGVTATCQLSGGCTIGKITAFAYLDTVLTLPFILASGDAGVTWHWIADPTATGYVLERIRRCGNGLVASSYGGASMASHAFGLRGGLPL